MGTAQVEFTEDELLSDLAVSEPLLAGGVRCHGGFDAAGTYVSPRTRFRAPAIAAWGEQNCERFDTELIDVPLERWERSYPNVEQARFLIRAGVPEPLMATLTRIGTVEGYGANIRLLKPKDMQRHFVEDVRGTAIDHLGGGLFEAHGRDEAGWEEEAGHRDMWFAARDIAFERPADELDIEAMLARMGFGANRPGAGGTRLLPDDVSPDLEMMVSLMVRVLFIEISAFHTFAWAESWMSDTELVAGEGAAAQLVSYIRSDETPHVGYLRTALSEMRDRTWVGETGTPHAGTDMIGRIWEPLLAQSLGPAREDGRRATRAEVEHWCARRAGRRRRPGRVQRPGRRMKFGVFYEHQLPRPWEEGSEYRLLQDALEQVELADHLGFDVVWEVEHHFLEEYSHSSAPEVFLGAASQRTKNIRLGHGIIQTAPGYNHPARTAERVATLDLLSGGRVEFGSGESGSEAELGGFLVDPATKRAAWLEGLEVALRCMTETPFTGVDGAFVQMPPRNVVPKPMQKPHPPLWVACSRRDTILLAAEKGIGALTFAFIDPEEAVKWVSDYERTLAESCVPVGQAVNPSIACVTQMMCHPDEEEALSRGLEGGNFFGYSLGHYYVFGEHQPGSTDVWEEFLDRRGDHGYSPEVEAALRQERLGARLAAGDRTGLRGATGTPAQVREYLERFEEAGVDQVIFVLQAGKNRHEDICESLELFGREVLPAFKERDQKQVQAKADRLAPALEAALARKADQPPPPALPADYSFPAMPRRWAEETGSVELREWLEHFAESRAKGIRDEQLGILGN